MKAKWNGEITELDAEFTVLRWWLERYDARVRETRVGAGVIRGRTTASIGGCYNVRCSWTMLVTPYASENLSSRIEPLRKM